MVSRQKEQLVGLLIIIVGIWLTWSIWTNAIDQGWYLVKAAGFGPAAVVLGIGLILVPSYKRERTQRGEDISKLSGLRLITSRWWVILVTALIAGFINLFLLGYF